MEHATTDYWNYDIRHRIPWLFFNFFQKARIFSTYPRSCAWVFFKDTDFSRKLLLFNEPKLFVALKNSTKSAIWSWSEEKKMTIPYELFNWSDVMALFVVIHTEKAGIMNQRLCFVYKRVQHIEAGMEMDDNANECIFHKYIQTYWGISIVDSKHCRIFPRTYFPHLCSLVSHLFGCVTIVRFHTYSNVGFDSRFSIWIDRIS